MLVALLMVKAKPKEYEDVTSPYGSNWRLQLKPGNKSGYYGVIPNKGKWQGMGYDPRKQEGEAVAARSLRQAAGCGHTGGKVRGMVQAGHENDPQPQEVRASWHR